jgi:aspartokinase
VQGEFRLTIVLGAKVLHFRSVELAQGQNIPLVLKKLVGAEHSTQVMREVMGMESGKVLAVNSMARIGRSSSPRLSPAEKRAL